MNRFLRYAVTGLFTSLAMAHASFVYALPEDREQPVRVSAERMEWDHDRQLGVYEGRVIATQGELTLNAATLSLYRGENGQLTRALAEGKSQEQLARLRDQPSRDKPEIQAWAEQIDYRPGEATVILTGQARLVQGQDSFKGHRLTYHLTTQNLQAEQAEGTGPDTGRIEVILTPQRNEETPEP